MHSCKPSISENCEVIGKQGAPTSEAYKTLLDLESHSNAEETPQGAVQAFDHVLHLMVESIQQLDCSQIAHGLHKFGFSNDTNVDAQSASPPPENQQD